MAELIDSYKPKTVPYAHQTRVFTHSRDFKAFALLLEQGTGKSKIIIDTAAYLWGKGRINTLIIIAPNGVHKNWAINEFPAHLPDYVDHVTAVWTANHTKKQTSQLEALFNTGTHLRILCMNVEALSGPRGTAFLLRLLKATNALLAIDESSTVKNPQAARTKTVLKLGKLASFRRIATGTPITKDPFDAYSQMNFLDEEILGMPSFVSFKARYAKLLDASSPLIAKIMRQGARFMPQIVAQDANNRPIYQNLEELSEKIKLYSARVLKKDCLDLPEKVYARRYYEMGSQQAAAYMTMKTQLKMVWGEASTTALNKLTMVMRLQQITSGYYSDDEEKSLQRMYPDGGNPKITALVALLEEIEGPVIIWCRFIDEIHDVYEAVSKLGSAGMYYGAIPGDERSQLIKDFQDLKTRFFIANKTACRGLTLTKAEAVVYYTNEFDLDVRLQSEDRAHRIGLDHTVVYYDMECEGTVDSGVIANLRGKKDVADVINGDPNIAWI